MRALIQRVSGAEVQVAGEVTGKIGPGIVILFGVTHTDELRDADYLAEKCVHLRIFRDDNDKMNLSLLDVKGEALIVSQFTLYGDTSQGRRPFFGAAARPELAIPCYERFIERVKSYGVKVGCGVFGAHMRLELVNDGPVTVMVETPPKVI